MSYSERAQLAHVGTGKATNRSKKIQNGCTDGFNGAWRRTDDRRGRIADGAHEAREEARTDR